MTVEQIERKALENKFIDLQTRNAAIYLPQNLSFISSTQTDVRVQLFASDIDAFLSLFF